MKLGNIWAAIVADNHAFDPVADRRDDLPHFGIRISENEGDFPQLSIAFENSGQSIYEMLGGKRRIIISIDRHNDDGSLFDTVQLFDGALDDAGDLEYGADDITLQFEARAANWAALEQNAVAAIGMPIADACAGDISDPTERLDGTASIVHWDRVTRQASVVPIIGAGAVYDLGKNFDRSTFRIRRRGKPLARVDVVLSAEWEQHQIDVVELGPHITDAFGGICSTINASEMFERWPVPGDSLGNDYYVIRSHLFNIAPPAWYNPLVVGQTAEQGKNWIPNNSEPISVKVSRRFFEPVIDAIGTSLTKRSEEVRLSLFNGGQGGAYCHDVEKIEIKLDRLDMPDIYPDWQANTAYEVGDRIKNVGFVWKCIDGHTSSENFWADLMVFNSGADPDSTEDTYIERWQIEPEDGSPLGSPAAPSFFNTARGALSIDHAILVAAKTIAYSQRNWEVEFECDAGDIIGLRCSHVLQVSCDLIPSSVKTVIGKVRSYEYEFSAEKAICKITLAVSSGSGQAIQTNEGRVIGPSDGRFQVAYETPQYSVPSVQISGAGSCKVKNPGQAQEQRIFDLAAQEKSIFSSLTSHATAIEIDMVPVEKGDTKIVWNLNVLTAFQGFKGIQL